MPLYSDVRAFASVCAMPVHGHNHYEYIKSSWVVVWVDVCDRDKLRSHLSFTLPVPPPNVPKCAALQFSLYTVRARGLAVGLSTFFGGNVLLILFFPFSQDPSLPRIVAVLMGFQPAPLHAATIRTTHISQLL